MDADLPLSSLVGLAVSPLPSCLSASNSGGEENRDNLTSISELPCRPEEK